ncbi:MAG: hypothetical protein ACPLSP_02695, partial [Fervidicoccus fontis]
GKEYLASTNATSNPINMETTVTKIAIIIEFSIIPYETPLIFMKVVEPNLFTDIAVPIGCKFIY